ncbi:MAG: hypothetical protein CMA42_04270 [Euryarchaeota archaeon]|uniref:JAB domain-containing protein n=1 Tax=uncultured Poseidoniia archaeon TaxID=1697135 RepID=A0A1B1TA75_9ARCH|nr:hypothetical protein [uncultured Candidatus Thalassoarchaea sp.]MAS01364.1 hypothetical protein [Euryarchaeota archaeon]|tara:strand:- start:326 stop:1057 length:732 start_codon:yes stop_codon:yes gene_type:complete
MVLIQRCLLNGYMVDEWLVKSAQKYNKQSLENKDGYPAFILMPITTLEKIINWTFQSLPDEILVGMDPNPEIKNPKKIEDLYRGVNFQNKLFAGQGYILGEPHLVNRGDAFSVHHVPEEWNDGIFGEERGVRGGRFTTWLHTHPNAPAIPSMADADAAQWTEGCDMILGVRFSPEGIFPWFDDIEGTRRKLTPQEIDQKIDDLKPHIGTAITGHRIHELELISFHKRGFGINIILTDDEGNHI